MSTTPSDPAGAGDAAKDEAAKAAGRAGDEARGLGEQAQAGAGEPGAGAAGEAAEAAEAARAGEAVRGPAGEAQDAESRSAAGAGAATAGAAGSAAGAPTYHLSDSGEGVGEGAPRYGETSSEIPRSGSEDSWSSQPHPGFQAAPAGPGTNKRLAAGVLVGAVFLAGGVFAGYSILTSKSPNGNGPAPWTAAVTSQGAVVLGINAQNNVGTTGLTGDSKQAIRDATAACATVTADTRELTTTTGTVASIGDWAVKATPDVNALKADAASLSSALDTGNAVAVADSAKAICTSLATVSALPAMPDAAGSRAWDAGLTAYANAAGHALKGAAGDSGSYSAARQDLAEAEAQLNALAARIIAAT